MTGTDVLRIEGLTVRYGKVPAARDVKLTVRKGQITTIIGSNGAGKTTVLKAIMGLLPYDGRVVFDGVEVTGWPVDRMVTEGVALVPEGRRLFPGMTVRENLELGAYRRDDERAVKADFERVLSYFPVLAERLDSRARNLSGGQQQILAVGRGLMNAPRLLLLDEPSIGLAPAIVKTIAEIIGTISETGVDVLLIEQNAHMALKLSERAYVLENGAITMEGPSEELAESSYIREAYLGI